MPHQIIRFDHVQLAMPTECEAEADSFYAGLLGFAVLEKPPALAARGGRWFGNDAIQVHLGVERDFRPARKAHPAFLVDSLNDLVNALETNGHPVTWDTDNPGIRRCYVDDPFGNRIELIAAGG
jgi:catechol 2,3-dioxygenase-like lactoylglutathione lyase family enzyme